MNTKIVSAILVASFLLGAPVMSFAANPGQCRDAKGKFIKCPPPPLKTVQCRDAKGKFTKCPTAEAPARPKQCRGSNGKFAKC